MPYGRDIQVVGCSRPFFCRPVLWNKFGSNEKSRTFALPFEKRVADEALSSSQDWRMRIRLERFFENFSQKSCRFKKYAYLCSPVRKTGSRKRIWEVHWKDCFTVQEASTEKYNLSRSVNSFERIIKCQDKLRDLKLYNEEFDPGSGWTLAAGLTHASRGAAWGLAITLDGDRRKGA